MHGGGWCEGGGCQRGKSTPMKQLGVRTAGDFLTIMLLLLLMMMIFMIMIMMMMMTTTTMMSCLGCGL